MLNLINELFINATILVAFITFGNLFFREKGENRLSPVAEKVLIGFMSGILGCILMLYSVRVTPKFILDFRYLPIIITALYISPVSAMITALVIGIFRVSYFGFSQSSIIGFFISILVGVGCSIIGRLSVKSWLKWIYCNLSVYIVVGTAFKFLLGFSPMYYQVLIIYCIGTALISVGMFYFTEYLDSSNQHYRKMREEFKKDFLTGLYNVRQFEKQSSRILQQAGEVELSVSLLLIDIDNFKNINDFYGHVDGDTILKEFGKILAEVSRCGDLVSRNGGDEFTVLLPDCPLGKAIEVAERIRKNVDMHEFKLSSGKKIRITVSVGITSFSDSTDTIENLLEQADIALYHAKRAGKNQVMVANQEK